MEVLVLFGVLAAFFPHGKLGGSRLEATPGTASRPWASRKPGCAWRARRAPAPGAGRTRGSVGGLVRVGHPHPKNGTWGRGVEFSWRSPFVAAHFPFEKRLDKWDWGPTPSAFFFWGGGVVFFSGDSDHFRRECSPN